MTNRSDFAVDRKVVKIDFVVSAISWRVCVLRGFSTQPFAGSNTPQYTFDRALKELSNGVLVHSFKVATRSKYVYSSFFYYNLQQSTFAAGKHFLWTLSNILPLLQVLMKPKYRDEQVRYLEQCSRTANLPRALHLPPIQGIGTRLNQLNLPVGRTQTFGFMVCNCNITVNVSYTSFEELKRWKSVWKMSALNAI